MNSLPPQGRPSARVTVLGRALEVQADGSEQLEVAAKILEDTFHDMEVQCQLRWGSVPQALDTPSWYLLGALNLAHRVARLEQEANQHTRDLEQTLSKLLGDVPDDPSSPVPLLDVGED